MPRLWLVIVGVGLLVALTVAVDRVITPPDAPDPGPPPVVGRSYPWHGFYLAESTTVDQGRRAKLMYVDGRFPGIDISAGRWWSFIVGLSPSGDRVIVEELGGGTWVVGPTGPLLRLEQSYGEQFSWRSDRLIVGCGLGGCSLIDPRDGSSLGASEHPDPFVTELAISPNGRLATGSKCGATGGCTIEISDVASQRLVARFWEAAPSPVWMADGRLLVVTAHSLLELRFGKVTLDPNEPHLDLKNTPQVEMTTRVLMKVPFGVVLAVSPRAAVAAAVNEEVRGTPSALNWILSDTYQGRLWVIDASGSPREVTGYHLPGHFRPLTVSADGRYLSILADTDRGERVAVRDLVTGEVEYACDARCVQLFIY